MCGIVGYVGRNEAVDVLLNGLKRLEYRGYDSAGIAVLDDGHLRILKDRGKVKTLVDRVYGEWSEEFRQSLTMGIAHTRWATHGPPDQPNAHPHLDAAGNIALVHNGIIENYSSIRAQLARKGHKFSSETDSEVLVHLIGEYYQGDLRGAVCAALKQVVGTYGIAVIGVNHPGEIVVARKGSPILIGVGEHEAVVASDAAAVVAHTQHVVYLEDGDVAVVKADELDVCDIDNVPVTREIAAIEWDHEAAEKGGFAHFMLKEIFEQPEALRNTIRGRLDLSLSTAILSGLSMSPREMAEIQHAVIVACGTSMHAGMVGEYFFEDLVNMPADVEQAAEFRYRNPIVTPRDLVLAISQSGETADTLAAVREAHQKGAVVAGICNVVGSTIARETKRGVYLHAGPEIGVASTKAFTCQVAVLLMMALKFGRGRRLSREVGEQICRDIQNLPILVERVLKQDGHIAEIAAKYAQAEDMFFIGRGYMYPVALEGALKMKEISYIHAEGYHAAELKHGPIALLQPNVPVVALANDVPGKDKTLGNIQECRARKAPVIATATEGDTEVAEVADDVIYVPDGSHFASVIPTVVALQLLAYHVARLRGCEIDQPRNLAKSVTVE